MPVDPAQELALATLGGGQWPQGPQSKADGRRPAVLTGGCAASLGPPLRFLRL